MKCIIIETCSRIDLNKVKEHGDILYLFQPGETRSSIWSEKFLDECMTALQRINYDNVVDAIVIAGAVIPITLLIARLCAFENVMLLLWNANEDRYILKEAGE